MSAVWLRARAQLRGRARTNLLLVVLIGLAGGVVLAAVAGSRRTDTALPQFLAFSHTTDAQVWFIPSGQSPFDVRSDLAAERRVVSGLPWVRSASRGSALIVSGTDPASPSGPRRQIGIVVLDRGGGQPYGRPMVVAGRLPREDRAEEVAVDEELAERRGLRVGSTYRIGTYTMAQFGPAGEGVPIPSDGPTVDLRVAGIVRQPDDLLPPVDGNDDFDPDESSQLYLTPGFWHRYGPDLANYGIQIGVDLHRGQADLPKLTTALQRRFGERAIVRSANLNERNIAIGGVRRAIALESAALLGFAALAALAGLLLVGQTLGRQLWLETAEYPTLRALGMTRAQLMGVALVRAAVVGGGGAAVALATAVALSPLTPIGVARRAELNPGVAVDGTVLAVGGLAIVMLVGVGAALPAWRAARTPGNSLRGTGQFSSRRASRVVDALASAALGPSAVTGVRLALEPGRGRTSVPVRAAMAGAAAAVCAVTATAGFGASLTHLSRTPSGYGVTWDLGVGNLAGPQPAERVARLLVNNPDITAAAGLLSGLIASIDGHTVPIIAIEGRKGVVSPTTVEGREPLHPDEIALGSLTMRALGKQVGDPVSLSTGSGPPQQLRVVGRVVLNEGDFDAAITPGKGGIVHPTLYRRRLTSDAAGFPFMFLVRLDPRADWDQTVARLRADGAGRVIGPRPHSDLRNIQRVAYLPGVLAALVVVLGVGTVAHTLVSSIRRRRRDLAILRTLGFVRSQVSATVAWQASTFAAVAILAGLPLGIAAGRWAWRLTVDQLGVASAPVSPPLSILAIAAGTVLAANVLAGPPGWIAGRIRPAVALRSE